MIDSFEVSKVAGAVLAALLVIFVPKTIIDIWQQGHHAKEAGFTLPAASGDGAGAAASGQGAAAGGEAAATFDAAKVAAMIATAKPENGQASFKKCLTCHSADKAAASKAGPNLWNVVGRKKGSREDFGGYSEAMKTKGGEWTFADLAGFAHNPKGWLPGTKMVFQGVSDPQDVADLLAYIRTLADSPAPLPN
jgi:cytochrome c